MPCFVQLDIGRSMFDWDLQAVSSVYYLFIFEEDPGDSEKYTVGIKMTFPLEEGGEVEGSGGYELTVKDNDEYLGSIRISHQDPTMGWNEGEGLSINTIHGSARIMISYDGLQLW
ncbi:MAG: hypothetical protein PF541_15035 [Prolixibacteraceae bacterium]|nr:hypothetical protein [Prolixibacteraceae bacterium]